MRRDDRLLEGELVLHQDAQRTEWGRQSYTARALLSTLSPSTLLRWLLCTSDHSLCTRYHSFMHEVPHLALCNASTHWVEVSDIHLWGVPLVTVQCGGPYPLYYGKTPPSECLSLGQGFPVATTNAVVILTGCGLGLLRVTHRIMCATCVLYGKRSAHKDPMLGRSVSPQVWSSYYLVGIWGGLGTLLRLGTKLLILGWCIIADKSLYTLIRHRLLRSVGVARWRFIWQRLTCMCSTTSSEASR